MASRWSSLRTLERRSHAVWPSCGGYCCSGVAFRFPLPLQESSSSGGQSLEELSHRLLADARPGEQHRVLDWAWLLEVMLLTMSWLDRQDAMKAEAAISLGFWMPKPPFRIGSEIWVHASSVTMTFMMDSIAFRSWWVRLLSSSGCRKALDVRSR